MNINVDPPQREQSAAARGCDAAGLQLYIEGDELYAAMRAEIAAAQAQVRIETYILATDDIGVPLIESLCAAARGGVRVQLRIDALGSIDLFDDRYAELLRAAGVKLEWCKRWSWRRPWHFGRRNHRKLLVVDERCFFLGGYNIHRQSSQLSSGPERWRDTHLRVCGGPLVAQAIRAFDEYLRPDLSWRQWRFASTQRGYLLPNLGLRRRFVLYRLYRRRFHRARQRIWLTTPYFVPPAPLQRALVRAAKRGVDVRVLVPRRIDIALVQWASRAAYARLLRGGVKIYEYLPRMLHAKVALVDGQWATVGTANLDYRSLFINDELVLVLHQAETVQRLATQFELDLVESEQVIGSTWANRRWLAWLAELIGWWARRWL